MEFLAGPDTDDSRRKVNVKFPATVGGQTQRHDYIVMRSPSLITVCAVLANADLARQQFAFQRSGFGMHLRQLESARFERLEGVGYRKRLSQPDPVIAQRLSQDNGAGVSPYAWDWSTEWRSSLSATGWDMAACAQRDCVAELARRTSAFLDATSRQALLRKCSALPEPRAGVRPLAG